MSHWLDPGLQHLLRLRLRAAGRMGLAKARTPTGLLAVFATIGFLGSFVAARLWLPQRGMPGETFATMGPIGMFVFWAAHVGLRGGGELLGFLPDEVDQLFAAPYSQNQLLRYKLSLLLVAWTLTAVFMTPVATLYAHTFVGGVLAALLILPFLQLSSMCIAMIRDRPASMAAKLAYSAVPVVLTLIAVNRADIQGLEQFYAACAAWLAHPVGRILMLPFVSAVGLLTETTPRGLAGAGGAMVLINAGLAALLLQLGQRAWLENAADGAAAMRARFDKARSGGLGQLGGVWQVGVPMLPRMGGVGPIAWRRLVEVVRRPATTISLLGLAGLIGMAALLFNDTQHTHRHVMGLTLVGATVGWGIMLIPSTLRLDFRADLDRMDQLLALPIRPVAIVLGQILPMVGMLTLTEWLILAALIAWAPSVQGWAFMAMSVVPVLAWLVMAVENLFFLLLPVRIEAGEAALQSVGTNLLVTFGSWTVQGLITAIMVGIGAGIGVFFDSHALGTAVTACGLAAAAAATTVLAAWRFQHFDPSRDVPG